MTRPTIAKVNAAISDRFPGREIEFVKGRGYFYFAGEYAFRIQVESINVYALNQMSLEQWIERAVDHIETAIEEYDDDDGGYEMVDGVIVIRPHNF